MIGLGRMGGNMVSRLLGAGHRMIAFDQSPEVVQAKVGEGAIGAGSLQELAAKFTEKPRIGWVMVPAGEPTTQTIAQLSDVLEPGDIVIDGGNTNWQLAMKDAEGLKAKGMHYLDAGTSGGIWGLKNGYGLMVGGEAPIFEHCKPLLTALAPTEGGLVHCGAEGSGHFVKMVHNGIEYGLMQAYGEGLEIIKKSPAFPGMDLQGDRRGLALRDGDPLLAARPDRDRSQGGSRAGLADRLHRGHRGGALDGPGGGRGGRARRRHHALALRALPKP